MKRCQVFSTASRGERTQPFVSHSLWKVCCKICKETMRESIFPFHPRSSSTDGKHMLTIQMEGRQLLPRASTSVCTEPIVRHPRLRTSTKKITERIVAKACPGFSRTHFHAHPRSITKRSHKRTHDRDTAMSDLSHSQQRRVHPALRPSHPHSGLQKCEKKKEFRVSVTATKSKSHPTTPSLYSALHASPHATQRANERRTRGFTGKSQ